jgi:hypothetical protein
MASVAEAEMSLTLAWMFWLKRRKRLDAKRTTKPISGKMAMNSKVSRQF